MAARSWAVVASDRSGRGSSCFCCTGRVQCSQALDAHAQTAVGCSGMQDLRRSPALQVRSLRCGQVTSSEQQCRSGYHWWCHCGRSGWDREQLQPPRQSAARNVGHGSREVIPLGVYSCARSRQRHGGIREGFGPEQCGSRSARGCFCRPQVTRNRRKPRRISSSAQATIGSQFLYSLSSLLSLQLTSKHGHYPKGVTAVERPTPRRTSARFKCAAPCNSSATAF
mmetsp:Transcript_7545/g.17260  ORF Transcript_7545/g.17260 Transcript_7545/m.17260 type:complete len:225 (-) Transcript_7545:286-960(-)